MSLLKAIQATETAKRSLVGVQRVRKLLEAEANPERRLRFTKTERTYWKKSRHLLNEALREMVEPTEQKESVQT